jgi:hypothetical protein
MFWVKKMWNLCKKPLLLVDKPQCARQQHITIDLQSKLGPNNIYLHGHYQRPRGHVMQQGLHWTSMGLSGCIFPSLTQCALQAKASLRLPICLLFFYLKKGCTFIWDYFLGMSWRSDCKFVTMSNNQASCVQKWTT